LSFVAAAQTTISKHRVNRRVKKGSEESLYYPKAFS
jgi:hypothetical protein